MKRQMYFENELKSRSSDGGEKVIEGYFVVFNQATRLYEGVYEEVMRTAVEETVKNDDIRCLLNHDTSVVLGRTSSGTASLSVDDHGIYGRIKINPNDQQANDAYARVERGDISGCSYMYEPTNEERQVLPDGSIKYILREAKIYEVSIVTFPAYPTTQIQARQQDEEKIKKEVLEKRRKELKNKFGKESK